MHGDNVVDMKPYRLLFVYWPKWHYSILLNPPLRQEAIEQFVWYFCIVWYVANIVVIKCVTIIVETCMCKLYHRFIDVHSDNTIHTTLEHVSYQQQVKCEYQLPHTKNCTHAFL